MGPAPASARTLVAALLLALMLPPASAAGRPGRGPKGPKGPEWTPGDSLQAARFVLALRELPERVDSLAAGPAA
jgi:hypothetical protein